MIIEEGKVNGMEGFWVRDKSYLIYLSWDDADELLFKLEKAIVDREKRLEQRMDVIGSNGNEGLHYV